MGRRRPVLLLQTYFPGACYTRTCTIVTKPANTWKCMDAPQVREAKKHFSARRMTFPNDPSSCCFSSPVDSSYKPQACPLVRSLCKGLKSCFFPLRILHDPGGKARQGLSARSLVGGSLSRPAAKCGLSPTLFACFVPWLMTPRSAIGAFASNSFFRQGYRAEVWP